MSEYSGLVRGGLTAGKEYIVGTKVGGCELNLGTSNTG